MACIFTTICLLTVQFQSQWDLEHHEFKAKSVAKNRQEIQFELIKRFMKLVIFFTFQNIFPEQCEKRTFKLLNIPFKSNFSKSLR
jgi:hypothetical protein